MPNRPGPTPRVAASLPRLRAMARAGLSTAQAARALGVTRNAVIGRARDYDVRFHGEQSFRVGKDAASACQGSERPAAPPSPKSLETSSHGR